MTNAQKASILESCIELEEFIKEFYVGHSEYLNENAENKVEALELYSDSKDFFWIPSANGYGSYPFVITSNGFKCYFINKKGLPDEIRKNVKGGDAGEGSYLDYALLNDVYGITADLKVYYCSNGINSMLGTTRDKLDLDNPERIVFGNSADGDNQLNNAMCEFLKKYDIDGDGILQAREIRGLKELTITSADKISSFAEVYCLTNLQKITCQGLTIDTVDGLSLLPSLVNITFENCIIKNYDNLSKCVNLDSIYFIFNDNNVNGNEEVKKICGKSDTGYGLSQGNLTKLKKFSICGSMDFELENNHWSTLSSNISDLSPISNISSETKKSIINLYIQNNKIDSIDYLDGFDNLEVLNCGRNNIGTLKGLRKFPKLISLEIYQLHLGDNDTNNVNDMNNALYDVQFCANLERINGYEVSGNVKWISYIKNLDKLNFFRLDGAGNLDVDDLTSVKTRLKRMEFYLLNRKYWYVMLDETDEVLELAAQSIKESEFIDLTKCTNLRRINLMNVKITDNDGTELSDERSNSLLNEVLAEFHLVEKIDASDTRLMTLDFIYNSYTKTVNTPNLDCLILLNDKVTDLKNLNYLDKLTSLGINNASIELTDIQKVISNCSENYWTRGFYGFYTNNVQLMKKLENCVDVTSLYIACDNWKLDWRTIDLDLSKLRKLEKVYIRALNLKSLTLPSSVKELTMKYCSLFPDLSTLSSLNYIEFEKGGIYDITTASNVITSLSSKMLNNSVKTSILINGINELSNLELFNGKYNCSKLELDNCPNLVTLKGISGMGDISEIICTNDLTLSSLADLENKTNLTKLTLSSCGIVDLSTLSNLKLLTYIDLRNNPLSVSFGNIQNLTILATLKSKSNNFELYMDGCDNILDWSELSKFSGWWHLDEKAGY